MSTSVATLVALNDPTMKSIITTHGNPGPMDAMPGQMSLPPGCSGGHHAYMPPPPGIVMADVDARLANIAAIINAARRQHGCRPQDADVMLTPAEVDRIYVIATGEPE